MNKNKLSPLTIEKILELRSKFTTVNSILYTFSEINKRYPLSEMTEEEAKQVVQAYEILLERIKNYSEKL